MPTMTGGQAVVRVLRSCGVDTVFSLPGAHTLPIYDALYEEPGIRHVTVRHEQGAAAMADGYARASGRVGVAITTTGPACANAASALGEAWADCSPVLLIASTVPSTILGKSKGWVHEGKDQTGMLKAIVSHHYLVDRAKELPRVLCKALCEVQEGRPGPAVVEVPMDFLFAEEDFEIPPSEHPERFEPDPQSIQRAAVVLAETKLAVMWAGGGVIASGAEKELQQLADLLGSPIVSTPMGRGAIPDDHPLHVGAPHAGDSVARLLSQAEVLVAVGTRFGATTTNNWKLPLPPRIIQIDVDAGQLGKNFPVEVPIHADARAALRALFMAMQGSAGTKDGDGREALVRRVREELEEDVRRRRPEGVAVLEAIRGAVGRRGITIFDVTTMSDWARRHFGVYEPRTFISAPGYSCMGLALPQAIGAKLACPDKPVAAFCGDGGFMMTCAEMSTAAQLRLPIVVVVFNDGAYGIIKRMQRERYSGRYSAVELRNPDFCALAESFGWGAARLKGVEGLEEALKEALQRGEPELIEVQVDLNRLKS